MMAIPGILRTRIGLVWFGLVLATAVSFLLGTDHGLKGGDAHAVGTSIVLAIAFVKINFIGMEFMELRAAPPILRLVFRAWCLLVGGAVIGLFLAGQ